MRNIFIVNATQVITSDSHPEGLYSVISGFPRTFDSYDRDEESAMKEAKAAYFAQLSTNYANINPNRVMTTVTLSQANGRLIMNECIGSFPIISPTVEPETETEEEPTEGGDGE